MTAPDDQLPSPTPAQQDTPPRETKADETLVYCKLDNVRTVITTLAHCRDILRGQVVGKPPPDDTALVTCVSPDGTVSTTAADCTGVLQGNVQTTTPIGG